MIMANEIAKTKAFYFDKDNKPCQESDAAKIQVVSYDKHGREIESVISKCENHGKK